MTTNKRLNTPWTTHYMHTGQDRWIQTELVFTLAKNATKPNPLEIISLQTKRKENNWKTEETLARAAVNLETEQIKGSNAWCLWWWLSVDCPNGRAIRDCSSAEIVGSNPAGVWMFVCCGCCVLSGRGLCDDLITRPEESYRMWCVVVSDLETSWMRRPWPTGGAVAAKRNKLSVDWDVI
jgi:hypothetical protein